MCPKSLRVPFTLIVSPFFEEISAYRSPGPNRILVLCLAKCNEFATSRTIGNDANWNDQKADLQPARSV